MGIGSTSGAAELVSVKRYCHCGYQETELHGGAAFDIDRRTV